MEPQGRGRWMEEGMMGRRGFRAGPALAGPRTFTQRPLAVPVWGQLSLLRLSLNY